MSEDVDPRSRHSPETWAEVDRLFRAALGMRPEERSHWLAGECSDAFLRSETERLLRAHGEVGDFLQSLDTEAAALLVNEPPRAEPDREAVGPYRIVRLLARGGMGVVYLARDERLDRSVALKCLSPRLDTDPDVRERFLGEARAASRLDHPNIATVHDVGETSDGGLYIAMSYYEGETLAQRIARSPLQVDEALALATQIAGALAAAHSAGIVHRDVKPANVIVTPDGQSKVLDFGIAKTEDGYTTRAGVRLGTVAYMSPEQTRGEPMDARTDVWSFGALLYELLTGRRPFRGQDDAVVIHAIRHDDPVPVVELRPQVPPGFVEVVERCLAREPSERFRSAAQVEEALRAVGGPPIGNRRQRGHGRPPYRTAAIGGIAFLCAILIAALAVFSGVGDGVRDPGMSDPTEGSATVPVGAAAVGAAEPPRLAVLPLADLGGPAADEYLANGLTDDLTSRLSALRQLRVIGRASIMTYRDTERPIVEIARELNADVLLDGAVHQTDDRVRITVQLVDGRTGERLWSDEYDAELGDLLSVQSEIAERVVDSLRPRLRDGELPNLRDQRPANQEAYLSYLRGRYYWGKRTPEGLERARAEFRRALDLDPAYAEAWAGLADTYELLASVGKLPPAESARLTRAAADRALEIDEDLAEAHSALATVLTSYYWDWEGATEHFRRALASNPNYWNARHRYANLLAIRGRFDEAIRQARMAADLDPLSSYARAAVGYTLYLARRYDDAVSHLEAATRIDPDFFLTHLDLGLVYARSGMPDRAVAAATEATRLSGRYQAAVGVLGHAYGLAGRSADARALLRELAHPRAGRHVSPFNLGMVHLGLGEHDRAIEYFEEAASQRASLAEYLGVDPVFDTLRSYPRFERLLREHDLYLPKSIRTR